MKTQTPLKVFAALALLTLGLGIKTQGATDYYVSPTGSDANTGLSISQPWTLAKGLEWITNGNTVWMMTGEYAGGSPGSPHQILNDNNTATRSWLKSLEYRGARIVAGNPGLTVLATNIGVHGITVSNATTGVNVAGADVILSGGYFTSNSLAGIWIDHGATRCKVHNNVVEHNGNDINDRGIACYGNTSEIFSNIVRTNRGFGIWVTPLNFIEPSILNKVYNNITEGHVDQAGMRIISSSSTGTLGDTNWIYNNNIMDGLWLDAGFPQVYNNVIYPGPATFGLAIYTNPVAPFIVDITTMDYNFATNTLVSAGANDLIIANYTKDILFPSNSFGQYWLSYTNPLRHMATRSTLAGSMDWFNRPRLAPKDIGAIQYEEEFETDTRDLNNTLLDPYFCNVPSFRVVGHKAYHNVRWNVTTLNVAGHCLYRKAGGGAYAKVADIAARDINYVDLTGALSDGVVYTYKLTSTNLHGNTIDSQEYAITCDKLSTVHPDRRLIWSSQITGLTNGVWPSDSYSVWADITVDIPGTNIVAIGDGVTDNRGAFAAALNLAPSNSIIYIGTEGEYQISGDIGWDKQSLTTNNNKVLRGINTNVIIKASSGFTGSSMFKLGRYNEQTTDRVLTSRLAKGATQMTWVGGYGTIPIVAGSLIMIWENDASGRWGALTPNGGDADPVYNSNDGANLITASAPLVRQLVRVISLPGSGVINFWPPLMQAFSKEATCRYQYLYMCNNSGLENLTFDNTEGIETTNNVSRIIDMEGGYGNWLRNIRTIGGNSSHIRAQWLLNCTMDGGWHAEAAHFTANAGIGLQLLRDVDSCVIMNNVYKTLFPHIEKQKSIDGNVFIGNFQWDPKSGLAPMLNHGGHNRFNLYEFEDGHGWAQDGYFNSEQDPLIHRSYYSGYHTNFGAVKVLALNRFTRAVNVENSRLGLQGFTNWVTTIYTNGWDNSWHALYRWGYPNIGNNSYTATNTWYHYTNMADLDSGAIADSIIHGVHNTATGAIDYDPSNPSRTWRYSYFLDWNNITPPTWYTNAIWPPVGVDSGTITTNWTTAGTYFWSTILSYIPPANPGFPLFPDLGPVGEDYFNKCYFVE